MRGVIIAGGKGSRLYPLTKTINKNLLPIYDKPMIYYSIEMLRDAGIKEILIVTGTEHSGQFINLLESGDEFGVKLHYEVQKEPLGPADAINVAKDFARGEKIVVIFSDNIFEYDIKKACEDFKDQKEGAKIFLKEVSDPERFGVAEVKDGKVIAIKEKPKNPKSNLAVVGLYMYDKKAFDIIATLKPSQRGEYEVTDLNNFYVKNNEMTFEILKGHWTDAGTFDSLLAVNNWVAEKRKK
ncbi:NTP transferase domain-containing protein [Candidatus Azambacteria bacterium]|nr:NTP transferase domain-containing protein [Candidatus Azambacteria bacterium]